MARTLLNPVPFLLSMALAQIPDSSSPDLEESQLQCDIENQLVNASDQIIFSDPFRTPNGIFENGSGDWTWTLATQSAPLNGNDTLLSQTLSLSIDPPPDLLSESNYTGCGIILHGLKHDAVEKGQNDAAGHCEGSISQKCRDRLLERAKSAGTMYTYDGNTIGEVCKNLQGAGDPEIEDCKEDFGENRWMESFAFAHPLLSDSSCSFQPAASNESHVIYSWAESRYGLENLTAYNNLTTLIEPIITVLLTPSRNTLGNDEKWSNAQIMCLRTGENVAGESAPAPSEVPETPGSLAIKMKVSVWHLTVASAVSAFVTMM